MTTFGFEFISLCQTHLSMPWPRFTWTQDHRGGLFPGPSSLGTAARPVCTATTGMWRCSNPNFSNQSSHQVRSGVVQLVIRFRGIHSSVGFVEQLVNRHTLRPFRNTNAQAQLEPFKIACLVPLQ